MNKIRKYKIALTYEFEVEACHKADALMEGIYRMDSGDLDNYKDAVVTVIGEKTDEQSQ